MVNETWVKRLADIPQPERSVPTVEERLQFLIERMERIASLLALLPVDLNNWETADHDRLLEAFRLADGGTSW